MYSNYTFLGRGDCNSANMSAFTTEHRDNTENWGIWSFKQEVMYCLNFSTRCPKTLTNKLDSLMVPSGFPDLLLSSSIPCEERHCKMYTVHYVVDDGAGCRGEYITVVQLTSQTEQSQLHMYIKFSSS